MELLAYIGILSILAGLGWLGYWLSSQIKWRNPIKRYIRKVVMDYLKELQND
jgi:predicted DNA-binding transcriptional regulator